MLGDLELSKAGYGKGVQRGLEVAATDMWDLEHTGFFDDVTLQGGIIECVEIDII